MPFTMIATEGWEEGDCVLRIKSALAALVDAAGRNLRVGERTDCDACRYGFPIEMMAKDFHSKAIELALEVASPQEGPITYPIDKSLPVDIRRDLQWLHNILYQQMQFWGWGWPFDGDDDTEHRLIYRISEHDLEKFRLCLRRLAESIAMHPAPICVLEPPPAQSPVSGHQERRASVVVHKPASLVYAAAIDLKKEGKPVSLNAACKRAGVDRKNIAKRHPEVANAIRMLADPYQLLPRAIRDRRTGNLDAIEDDTT
jgi:hypothetical protein